MPKPPPKPQPRPPIVPNPPNPPEIVDPRWILSALGITIAVAILCAWVAVCALFYQGQWQIVLQPSRTVDPAALTSLADLHATEVHFGPDATGQPQLDGFWIPADTTNAPTALVLHSGAGSLGDELPSARILHNAELNVFLFDYRGFGHSAAQHPTQQLMQADAASALRYLTDIRSLPPSAIIVVGHGLGASLAVNLCAAHKDLAALILGSADGDFTDRARQDPRSRMVPVSLLFNQTFPLAAPLKTLATPKLIITYPGAPHPFDPHLARDPKMTVELTAFTDTANLHLAIRRFVDTYLTTPPNTLTPNP